MADECLGSGYLDVKQFATAIDPARPTGLLALVVETTTEGSTIVRPAAGADTPEPVANGDVVGFSIGAIRSPVELASYLELPRGEWPSALESADRTAVLQTIVIVPEWQGAGHGRRLLGAHAGLLETADPDAWCAVAWTQPDGSVPGASPLRSVGLAPDRTIEAYWAADSLAEGYRCATCGDPPCQCDATLFIKE